MPTNFLHGIEVIEVANNLVNVREVKTGIIGLVGIAPAGPLQKLTLVKNAQDAAQFGNTIPGFSIPQALKNIQAQGAGTVLVINVFDPTTHSKEKIEPATILSEYTPLSEYPISSVQVVDAEDAPLPYVEGKDFVIDNLGRFRVLGGRIPESTAVKFKYKYLDSQSITQSTIIGSVSANGTRTGMKIFDLAFQKFGFNPKIIIAPAYSHQKSVCDEMTLVADRLKAIALIDCEPGKTVNEILESRGDPTNAFSTASQRVVLLYPYLLSYDESKDDGIETTDTNTSFPYSAYFAGVIAATDNKLGYWYSPSNKAINGVTGIAQDITMSINDENADSNMLNAAGITTIFNFYGSGYRTWGNHNSSYPSNQVPNNFISIRRIADVVHESLVYASIPYIDQPLTKAVIDDMRHSGNDFINVLIGRNALLEGSKIVYSADDNPATELAKGIVKFRFQIMGPTPAQTIVYLSELNTSLYDQL
ncbi:hypothetical protein LX64_04173 [Chitinophaga skermanii]|uniref:Tail sheath protein subtilisin-like domain-containing protein n=1 Tax=Chitinophaga skermanii TaxID=331697 RepID=A0A327QFK8_9BACT|nr:phage tail sheath subtilisin-like domain-containing protein [Chitinophaga skermanii]RAJ00467.1 hypothetical protein LX64_04173 [Chitinophaga skermanii]